jgi:hypothetical protein
MIDNYNQTELESALAQAIATLGLRDILTRNCIPPGETVTVYLKRSDEVLASSEMPPQTDSVQAPVSQEGTSLSEEIARFLNQAQKQFHLGDLLPESTLYRIDEKTKGREDFFTLAFKYGDIEVLDSSAATARTLSRSRTGVSSCYCKPPGVFCVR